MQLTENINVASVSQASYQIAHKRLVRVVDHLQPEAFSSALSLSLGKWWCMKATASQQRIQ